MEATPVYDELIEKPEYEDLEIQLPEPEGTQDYLEFFPQSHEALSEILSLQPNFSYEHPDAPQQQPAPPAYSPPEGEEVYYKEEPHGVLYAPSAYDTTNLPVLIDPVVFEEEAAMEQTGIMDQLEFISKEKSPNYLGLKNRRKARGRNRR